jgi:predicted enzyme related to lactoylglutathione lyase
VPYVRVKNIRATVKKAKSLGAKVLADVMLIPGYGQIAVLADPSGTPIGLSQPAE